MGARSIYDSLILSRFIKVLALSSTYLLSGCATMVSSGPDNYQSYDCSQLQTELVKMGAIKSDASGNQDLTVGTGALRLIPFVGGAAVLANKAYNESAEGRAKAKIDNLFHYWDEKHCSANLYEKNKSKSP